MPWECVYLLLPTRKNRLVPKSRPYRNGLRAGFSMVWFPILSAASRDQDTAASTNRPPPDLTLRANMVERRINIHRSDQIGNIGDTMHAIEKNRDHRCAR